jgi:hypothetical protein
MTTANALTDALRAAFSDYRELQSEIEALSASQEEARNQIKTLVTEFGGKAAITGLASASVIPASTTHSYDTKAIDQLIIQLFSDGTSEGVKLAQHLTDARKSSTRKESLRITLDKTV